MTRAELETTARIKRDTLRGLLDEMTDRPPRPTRNRPSCQVAALLPPIERVRFPRSTMSPSLGRGSNPNMTRAEQKAAQTVADARAKLDGIDTPLPFPMGPLPVDLQLSLPEVQPRSAPVCPDVITVEEPVRAPNVYALVALFVGAFFVGLLGAYAVI